MQQENEFIESNLLESDISTMNSLSISDIELFNDLVQFMAVFKEPLPRTNKVKEWIAKQPDEGEKRNMQKKIQLRNDYCHFQRSFLNPILLMITTHSNSEDKASCRCIDRTHQEIVQEVASFIHSFLFQGKYNFFLNLNPQLKYPFPTVDEVLKRLVKYESSSSHNHSHYKLLKSKSIDDEENILPVEDRPPVR